MISLIQDVAVDIKIIREILSTVNCFQLAYWFLKLLECNILSLELQVCANSSTKMKGAINQAIADATMLSMSNVQ